MSDHDGLPWARRYTDPALFQLEQARLGTTWTLLGLDTDLPNDGDWIRATLGGRSVFVQRFGSTLHAFENVCAHRFFPLRTEDRGNGVIRCGFHHWQYNKEGLAVGIPKCKEMFGATPREVDARLTPVDIARCGALIFGRLTGRKGSGAGDPGTLEEYLGPGFPILEAMTRVTSAPGLMTFPIAANWKLGCNIALDDYHLVAVHPDTFGKGGYLTSDMVRYYRFGAHSAYFFAGKEGALEEMAAACEAGTYRPEGFRTFHIFPDVIVAHIDAAGTPWVVMQRYVAEAVDRTVLRTWSFPASLPAPDRGPLRGMIRRLAAPWLHIAAARTTRKITREDNEVCERLQSVATQAEGRARLARHEERIAWFEEAYAARVGDGP